MSSPVRFASAENDAFWDTLRSRVNEYFEKNNLSRHCNATMIAKSVFYLSLYIGPYVALVLLDPPFPAALGLWALTGLGIAGIGFNIAHDASHGGYSAKRWVNRLMAHSFTLVGVHEYNWNITHNIIHHTYTNIPYADGDLHPVPYLRYFDIDQEVRWYHKYQHLYAPVLYCLATVVWVFYKDYLHISRKQHVTFEKKKPPASEYFIMVGSKLLHYALFLVIPAFALDGPYWHVIVGFLLMHVAAGICLATVFAIGHVVEGIAIPRADEKGVVNDSWAAHQLRTSANFSLRSRFFFWAVGGLNFQVEHHLFPRVCHVHLPAISPLVKQTAAEFGLPYNEYETFLDGFGAHLKHLREFSGQRGEPLAAKAA